MEKERKEAKSAEEKETPSQDASTEAKNTDVKEGEPSQKDEGVEGEVEIDGKKYSKSELGTIFKKANDFDGIIEKNRLKKLNAEKAEKQEEDDKKNDKVNVDELIEKAKEEGRKAAMEVIGHVKKEDYDAKIKVAYSEFIDANKWADDDNRFSEISKHFKPDGADTKEKLLSRLEIAAQMAFPEEYKKNQEDKIKSKLLAEESSINNGDMGGSSSTKDNFEKNKKYTPEQARIASLCGNNPDDVYKD